MLVAQITDLHLGFDGPDKDCPNRARLRQVLAGLMSMLRTPDLVLVTGDNVESGERWAYELLKDELAALDWPYYFLMGNHDRRGAFQETFPDYKTDDGFIQYTIEDWPVRIIVLDTLGDGYHGGAICKVREAWLRARLAEQPERPTILAMHHAPVQTGIPWMTAKPGAPWVDTLRTVIVPYDNIVRIICGHIHRPITAMLGGAPVCVAPAVAPEVTLELAELDMDTPDARPMITDNPPGFALHYWDDEALISHSATCPIGKPLLVYDEAQIKTIRHTLDLDKD